MHISSASISLFQSQVLGSLMSSSSGAKARSDDSWASMFALLVPDSATADRFFPASFTSDPLSLLTQGGHVNRNTIISPGSSINGLSATGRNMALFDPESAYKMMTVINQREVAYKAQFSELDQMESRVLQMEDAGRTLGSIVLATGNEDVKSRLQDFVGQYNDWIQRFNPDVQPGGLLADTQAAHASRFELEQNVNNPFFGIRAGVHGLSDLGITIDPHTHLAALDMAQLDSLLASNKQGVVDAVQEFSANFARSADLLNAEGNFILKQLDNLERAIHYIADNKDSLQKEFGTGDAAHPTGLVAQALAAYNQTCGA